MLMVQFGWGQEYLKREEQWIEETMFTMDLDQKIGQMIIVRAFTKGESWEKAYFQQLIQKYHIGGVCFFQGSVTRQVQYTNLFHEWSKIPLFISIDGEWGLGMRHGADAISYPRNIQLGAIQDEKLIYQMGKEIAHQCRQIGVNFNFSPVADINNNPANPVIYERSFGESKENVTAKAFLMFKGLEDAHVLSCAKHFPGHGDTEDDSHYDLPVINHDSARLEEMEIFPFRRLAAQNIGSIMVGHLHLPQIDSRPNRPASLSKKVVTDWLRKSIGYQGLIVTDAMDMKAVTKHFSPGIAEAEAVLAGNDIILLPENVNLAVDMIKKYIREGLISEQQIDESVRRILAAKYRLGLQEKPIISVTGIRSKLLHPSGYAMKTKVAAASLTLLNDQKNLVPLQTINGISTATLSMNVIRNSTFQRRVDDYIQAKHFQVISRDLAKRKRELLTTLGQFNRVIVTIHSQVKARNGDRDLSTDLVTFLEELKEKTEVIVVFFGNPYLVKKLKNLPTVLLAFDNDAVNQDMAAQAVFGAIPIEGKIPVESGVIFPLGSGTSKSSLDRLGYAVPEQVGMRTSVLNGIDSLMAIMVAKKAIPGGQIVIAKDGKIIWQKEYGGLTNTGPPVQKNSVYDVASLTKILGTTLGVMKLEDEKKLSTKRPLRFYISDLISSNKDSLNLESVMAHHAGLRSYIPFYESTLMKVGKKRLPDTSLYHHTFSPEFSIPVAEKLFLRSDYRDTIWREIIESDVRINPGYRYSDLGFLLTQRVVEEVSRQPLDVYLDKNFYQPLGLLYTGYKPLDKIPQNQIAPTEIDNYFRMSTVRGTVHDMAAAMFGGVAGHAGIFSTAKEVTVVMQMILNKGNYGGITFFAPETVNYFTTRYSKSTRRGLGFDMKELNPKKVQIMSDLVSDQAFGHQAFTGSFTCADPEHNLVFTFITNRTYPSSANNTLHTRRYRPKLQTIIYQAIMP